MKVIRNSLTFLQVQNGLITTDEMLQSTGIELSEIRVPLLKFVNGDDIGMVKVLDSNKTTADKAPLIYLSSLW